jgi:hypothetical protein
MEYCTAGILCYSPSSENTDSGNDTSSYEYSPWLLRTKIRKYASFIHHFLHSLDQQRLYPFTTLKKLIYIIGRSDDVAIDAQSLINACVQTGLLVQETDQYWRKVPINESPAPPNSAIVMDTPFSFLAGPEIAYEDLIKLAAFSGIIEAGMTVRFELSRDSVVPAFDRGFAATAIIELLQRLSHNRIEDSVIFTLGDWEKRHGEVTLRRGLILTLSPEQRYLAETKPLARLITETLAPGIYMLPESAEDRVSEALKKAGVAIIAHGGAVANGGEYNDGPLHNFYQSLYDQEPVPPEPSHVSVTNALTHTASASTLIEGFHSILKGMRFGEEERDELSARINRRLVLCESQLKDALVRYEKLEARGLDYAGKALIAKQAVALQSPVEITWPGRQKQEYVFGIPKGLEKVNGETVLLIVPYNGEDIMRLPLGKISSLRRIKKSIFEG